MGADQSKAAAEQADKPIDYYELLQVSEDATDDEIKVRGQQRPPLTRRNRTVNWPSVFFGPARAERLTSSTADQSS